METLTFTCSICGEASSDICIACTKDTCVNHLCERCKRCSDCCVCEVRLVNHHDYNGKAQHELPLDQSESTPGLSVDELAPDEPSEA